MNNASNELVQSHAISFPTERIVMQVSRGGGSGGRSLVAECCKGNSLWSFPMFLMYGLRISASVAAILFMGMSLCDVWAQNLS